DEVASKLAYDRVVAHQVADGDHDVVLAQQSRQRAIGKAGDSKLRRLARVFVRRADRHRLLLREQVSQLPNADAWPRDGIDQRLMGQEQDLHSPPPRSGEGWGGSTHASSPKACIIWRW